MVALSGDTDEYGGLSLQAWGGDWGRCTLEGDFVSDFGHGGIVMDQVVMQ